MIDGLAHEVLARCDLLAAFSETPPILTRPFPSASMRGVHACVSNWMRGAGMTVRLDAVGNLIGHYAAERPDAPLLLVGSHLDTVPNAGKYDGVLGVLLGVATVQALGGRRLGCSVDVIAFCEEEGIRFRTPYLGSMAVAGRFDEALWQRRDASGVTLAEAFVDFGLEPARLGEAAYNRAQVVGYIEAHIEQGPVLDRLGRPLGVVEAIVGQTRAWLRFEGRAGHAGTLPMDMRQDALAAAAELVVAVETLARSREGLRATVGSLQVSPGAINVVPGSARLSLDVRHADDGQRREAVRELLRGAEACGARRGVALHVEHEEEHPAVRADARLTYMLSEAARAAGHEPLSMVSGAGHDAAVMASLAPMTMLFIRSPGGISHHPDESVRHDDVAAALAVLVAFLERAGEGQA